jgi:hypothetical protein
MDSYFFNDVCDCDPVQDFCIRGDGGELFLTAYDDSKPNEGDGSKYLFICHYFSYDNYAALLRLQDFKTSGASGFCESKRDAVLVSLLPRCNEGKGYSDEGLCCDFGQSDNNDFSKFNDFVCAPGGEWSRSAHKCIKVDSSGSCSWRGESYSDCTCNNGYYRSNGRCVGCDEVAEIKLKTGGPLVPATHMTSVSPRTAVTNCRLQAGEYQDKIGMFDISAECELK